MDQPDACRCCPRELSRRRGHRNLRDTHRLDAACRAMPVPVSAGPTRGVAVKSRLSGGRPVVRGRRRAGWRRRADARAGVVALAAAALVVSLGRHPSGRARLSSGRRRRPDRTWSSSWSTTCARTTCGSCRGRGGSSVSRGVRFANSFSPHPLCCPARASVLTGRYTHNHGVFDVKEPCGLPRVPGPLHDRDLAQARGYATMLPREVPQRLRRACPTREDERQLGALRPARLDALAGVHRRRSPRDAPGERWHLPLLRHHLERRREAVRQLQGQYQSNVYGRLSSARSSTAARPHEPFFLYVVLHRAAQRLPIEPDDPGVSAGATASRSGSPHQPGPRSVQGQVRCGDPPGRPAPAGSPRSPPTSRSTCGQRRRSTPAERRALRTVTRQRAEALAVVDRQVSRTVRRPRGHR